MTWFRIDDNFADHPKVDALLEGKHGEAAIALWTLAGAWCAKHLTDGVVPAGRVRRFGLRNPDTLATELVRVGLWEETADGFAFHDWHKYQPSRATVEMEREKTAERVRRHRDKAGRAAVLEKCGGECHYCGVPLTVSSMTIDHVTPVSAGGTGDRDNLVTACVSCNSKKKGGTLPTGRTCTCNSVPGDDGNGVTGRARNGVTNGAPVPSRPVPSNQSLATLASERERGPTPAGIVESEFITALGAKNGKYFPRSGDAQHFAEAAESMGVAGPILRNTAAAWCADFVQEFTHRTPKNLALYAQTRAANGGSKVKRQALPDRREDTTPLAGTKSDALIREARKLDAKVQRDREEAAPPPIDLVATLKNVGRAV